MPVVKETCPSCAAPLDIPNNVARVKCPYCRTSIVVQPHGSDNPQIIKSMLEAIPSWAQSSNDSDNRLTWLLFSTNGRIGQASYWLGLVIVSILFFLVSITSTNSVTGEPIDSLRLFSFILGVLFLWIGYAITAKRYHDRGKSGGWAFIALIPVIGVFWQIYELGFLPGDPGPNKYS